MKLTYFPARGRMEPTLLMLEMAGARYELDPIPVEAWMGPEGKPRMRDRTPFGQLPLLQDGELVLCHSRAIHRYVARKLGFYGDTLAESARVDEVAETADEIYASVSGFCWNPEFHDKRAEHRDATRQKLEQLQRYFLRVRADAEHWVLPGRYTMADAVMAYTLESILPLHPGLVQELPALMHVTTAFFASDRVREYVRSERRFRIFTVSLAQFGGNPDETHHWAD